MARDWEMTYLLGLDLHEEAALFLGPEWDRESAAVVVRAVREGASCRVDIECRLSWYEAALTCAPARR
ncbi:MAG TPA: hypothetical protein VLL82_17515 [Mycobacterium sp.]|nr:hypothetical protein [Mycobacterium sp.]